MNKKVISSSFKYCPVAYTEWTKPKRAVSLQCSNACVRRTCDICRHKKAVNVKKNLNIVVSRQLFTLYGNPLRNRIKVLECKIYA